MLSIRTNMPAYLAQRGLKNSSFILAQAVQRMTTGFKINHSKDDAANYQISQRLDSQISSLEVAEDNTAMGIDMLTTAEETLSMIGERYDRLRSLAMMAENNTMGGQSLEAINQECQTIVEQIKKMYREAEFNGMKLFGGEVSQTVNNGSTSPTPSTPTEPTDPAAQSQNSQIYATADTKMLQLGISQTTFQIMNPNGTVLESFDVYGIDTLQDVFDTLSQYEIEASITDGVISIHSDNGRYISGDLVEKLGIQLNVDEFIEESDQVSNSSVTYITDELANVSSTMAELGALTSGTDVVRINDRYGDMLGEIVVSSDTTLGELFEELKSYSIKGTVDDGVITFSSSANNYLVSSGVVANLGVEAVEGGNAVTAGLGQTSAGDVVYEQVNTLAGGTTTIQQEITTTIWITTTTSETLTETIWTTTTTSTTQTNTIWTTTTTSTTQTNTIWTTTTSSTTNTETIWTTTTTSTTQTNTIWTTSTLSETYTTTIWTTSTAYTTETETLMVDKTVGVSCSSTTSVMATVTRTDSMFAAMDAQINITITGYKGDGWVNTKSITPVYCETVQDLYDYFNQNSIKKQFTTYDYHEGDDLVLNISTMGDYLDLTVWNYRVGNGASIYLSYTDSQGTSYEAVEDIYPNNGYYIMSMPHTYSFQDDLSSTSTLEGLGISTEQYITVYNNGTETVITCLTTDTMSIVCENLATAGITAEVVKIGSYNYRFSVSASETSYISGMSDDLKTALKLSGNFTSVTTEYAAETITAQTNFMAAYTVRDTSTMTALASVDPTSQLTGTYCISTSEEMVKLSTMTNSGLVSSTAEFVLANDIDMSGVTNFTAIGRDPYFSNAFSAIFDGNGYAIKNLSNPLPSLGYEGRNCFYGLFGSIENATIKNLGLENFSYTNLYGSNKYGAAAAGLVVLADSSTIENCYVKDGYITTTNEEEILIDTFVEINNSTSITNCYAANVTVVTNSTSQTVTNTYDQDYETLLNNGQLYRIEETYYETETKTIYIGTTFGSAQTSGVITYLKPTTTVQTSATAETPIENITVTSFYLVNEETLEAYHTVVVTQECATVGDLENLIMDNYVYYINSFGELTYTGRVTKGGQDYFGICALNQDYDSAIAYFTYTDAEGNLHEAQDNLFDLVPTFPATLTIDTTATASSSTSLATLGIDSTQYITVQNNETQTVITLTTSDTIGSITARLTSAGITATFSAGKISLAEAGTTYISGMSDELQTTLKLSDDFYVVKTSSTETETIWTTTTTSDTETETIWITTTTSDTETETIWITTTTSDTETETIWITTTTSDTETETVWVTTTTSDTETETIWITTTISDTETTTQDVITTLPDATETVDIVATLATTFKQLGATSRRYITVVNNDTKTVITLKTTNTVEDMVEKLNSAGISAEFADGKLALTPNSKYVYISGMSEDLANILKLEADFYETSLATKNTDSNLISYLTDVNMRQTTTLNQVGVTSGSLLVKRNGEDYATISVSEFDTVKNFLDQLEDNGFKVVCANGKIAINAEGDLVLTDEIAGASNALEALGLKDVVYTMGETYSNSDSAEVFEALEYIQTVWVSASAITLQIGIGDDENSRLEISTGVQSVNLDKFANIGKKTVGNFDYLAELDKLVSDLNQKQVEIGSAVNRLDSVLDEISIRYENMVSTRSTLQDANIAEVTSQYIQQQILQQASATLLATANQMPSIALGLL